MSKTTYIQRYGTGEAQRRLAKIAKYIDKVAFGQTTPDEVWWYVLRTMRADIPYPESAEEYSEEIYAAYNEAIRPAMSNLVQAWWEHLTFEQRAEIHEEWLPCTQEPISSKTVLTEISERDLRKRTRSLD